MISRRLILGLLSSLALLAACATGPTAIAPSFEEMPPIVFVHGNGDTAALWQTTLWRFESNGWPRTRLHAIEVPYPSARADNGKEQPGTTSTAENMAYLKGEVEKVLKATGASKVALFGNSRGGNPIRDYIQNGGGAATVSHAILGGTPNHGVWAIKGFREGSEFSGTGPFLTALNTPKNANGDEVVGPVKWMTIRSLDNDKFAQPDGVWIGAKGTATNVTFAGPELKGATNVVIPRIDHRETSYSPIAFENTYRFITGKTPKTNTIEPEAGIVLNGKITGRGVNPLDAKTGNDFNNLPITGATIEIYATDAATGERNGSAVHRKTVGADGQWGPFNAMAGTQYEFVMAAPGYATTHLYRSAFPRSSSVIHLRPDRIADADKAAQSIVTLFRPRGYFDAERDKIALDGKTSLPGVPPAGAGVASSKLAIAQPGVRAISGEFNGERITGRTWPAAENRSVVLEITQ
jgi:triacylglycerol lipase